MPQTAKLIGGAGTGKTTELLGVLERVIETGVAAGEIGFASFTVAARAEAAGRAASLLGCSPRELTGRGWFRTLHSVAYQCLGDERGKLLADNKESRSWFGEHLGFAIEPPSAADPEFADSFSDAASGVASEREEATAAALRVWDIARNRLISFGEAWQWLSARSGLGCALESFGLELSLGIVQQYEAAKAKTGRCDFTDLLGKYAGWTFAPGGDPDPFRAPLGWLPELRVWFLDEAQDVTPLSWSVFRRLSGADSVQWIYLAGDPFQAIYDWAGADHSILLNAECDKQKIMPQSFRCPPVILSAGESVLRGCSDYFDRGIAPRAGEAGIVESSFLGETEQIIESSAGSVLCLARCNFQLARYVAALNNLGVPWKPTRGLGGWNRPSIAAAATTIDKLEHGGDITASEWAAMLEHFPTTGEDSPGLRRGIKTKFDSENTETKNTNTLSDWGANEKLIDLMRRGATIQAIKPQAFEAINRWKNGVEKFGAEEVLNPRIRVGTIHSVKGAEADTVLLSTGSTNRINQAAGSSSDAADSERRLAYVGFTRARRRVVVLSDESSAARGTEHEYILEGISNASD